MRSESELTAYYAFLWSEKIRHEDDIRMIDQKLQKLEQIGIKATAPGDWIPMEELDLGFA